MSRWRVPVSRLSLVTLGLVAATWSIGASPLPSSAPSSGSPPASSRPSDTPVLDMTSVPLLAYYYIWFDPSSWSREKKDLPALGPYSSDDESVMRQHITWAKSAGIDGFIVSWKNTTVLDKRLDALVRIAHDMNFKLEIIYEGLDFSRNPLPATQIAEDLDFFLSHYANDAVFDLFGKPMVIWSGTWKFAADDVAAISGPRRDRLLILASERSVDGFTRLSTNVDGNAYYWSSVNPDTSPNYGSKLMAMGTAVHDAGGLWIAPAAPGFDARLNGGTTVVDRQDGKTLERQMTIAIRSLPDAIGLISWNEFTENSEVEPSRTYGDRSLRVLAGLRKTNFTSVGEIDSSAPQGVDASGGAGRVITIVGVLGLGFIAVFIVLRWRRRARR